ncbi:hypothetical protein IQ07DRAFT_582700 [Pyrenochaeta sp. DS3sAY3a]|nr:hypothetical protein IQ07DRAFT_582700 [Pyrenochaeta sp. DS3sAY3a]
MPRTISLVVYNSRLFPAHWALWIPSLSDPNCGKRIHAEGDALTGFVVYFERNYNISTTTRTHQVIPLAQVLDHYVIDVPGDGTCSRDQTPHDYIEQFALLIPAPGASLASATSSEPRQSVTISNCQTWVRNVVEALVKDGVMDRQALRTIDTAPKN